MNPTASHQPLASAPRNAAAPQNDAAHDPAREALAHRFRHALQKGETNALFHLVLRHRQETV